MTAYEEHRLKGIGALLLGPILGLAYVIALPFITIATIVSLLGREIVGAALGVVRNIVSFGWRPSEAYLAGKKKKKKDSA